MRRVPAYPLVYEFSAHIPPRAIVAPGETFIVETEDALSGQIRNPGDRRDKASVPYSNPVAGPVEIEGARPGDAIAVTIHDIVPRDDRCATYTGPAGPLAEWLGDDVPHGAHVCPIRNGMVHWSESLAIPYRPMLGCVGVAPDWGTPTTLPSGPHGGNLDLVEAGPGATLILPVMVPGAKLYVGDAHAAMGHGELSATGLEMAALTTLSARVIPREELFLPAARRGIRIETDEFLMAVATRQPLERAIAEAYARLVLWMESEHGWNRWRAYDLLTHVGELSIGHYLSGTVGAKIRRSHLSNP